MHVCEEDAKNVSRTFIIVDNGTRLPNIRHCTAKQLGRLVDASAH